jgi:hypothetical protein
MSRVQKELLRNADDLNHVQQPIDLLLRNLSNVFGENDPVRRRAAIDEIAGVPKAKHPDFEYQPRFPPEELGEIASICGNRSFRCPERSHCFGKNAQPR